MNPDEHPFGETNYLNYNPNKVNTPEDVVEVLLWFAKQNEGNDETETVVAEIYKDAAELVSKSLIETAEPEHKDSVRVDDLQDVISWMEEQAENYDKGFGLGCKKCKQRLQKEIEP